MATITTDSESLRGPSTRKDNNYLDFQRLIAQYLSNIYIYITRGYFQKPLTYRRDLGLFSVHLSEFVMVMVMVM